MNKTRVASVTCSVVIPRQSVRNGRAGSSGYSLLELMIVMVVMGVVTSIAALSFGNFGAGAGEKTLQRLRLDVQLLSNESIIRSEVLALAFSKKGYAFMRLNNESNNWEVIEKDRFLKPREFTDTISVRMIVGEEEISLGESLVEPQIISLPTGEMTPFAYQLESVREDYRETLKFDALGRVVPEKDAAEQGGGANAGTATAS